MASSATNFNFKCLYGVELGKCKVKAWSIHTSGVEIISKGTTIKLVSECRASRCVIAERQKGKVNAGIPRGEKSPLMVPNSMVLNIYIRSRRQVGKFKVKRRWRGKRGTRIHRIAKPKQKLYDIIRKTLRPSPHTQALHCSPTSHLLLLVHPHEVQHLWALLI